MGADNPPVDNAGEGAKSEESTELQDQTQDQEEKEESTEKEEESSEDLEDLEGEEKVEDKEEPEESEESEETDSAAFAEVTERRKQIETKYPELFKEFPDLRTALYRDTQFREVFVNPEEARESAVKSEIFDKLNEHLLSGNPRPLFNALHEQSPKGLAEFISNFLPTLQAESQPLYLKASSFALQHFLATSYKAGLDSNDKNLRLAAQHLSRYLGIGDIPEFPKNDTDRDDDNPRVKALQAQLSNSEKQKFTEFRTGLFNTARANAIKLINQTLDPKGALDKLILKGLANSAYDEISDMLDNDKIGMARMNRLWANARKSGYNEQSKASILSAYLAGVRNSLSKIRSKYRIKTNASLQTEDNMGQQKIKKDIGGAAKTGGGKAMPSSKNIDYSKMSDRAILDAVVSGDTSKIALRK